MTYSLSIDAADGSIIIGGVAGPVQAGAPREAVTELLAALATGHRDHRNGFEWFNYGPVEFEGQICHVSLCFHEGRLQQAAWSVTLPGAPMEGDWPTRAAIDAEVAFVRRALKKQLGKSLRSGEVAFAWGSVWSSFDPKGFIAANGLRYAPHKVR